MSQAAPGQDSVLGVSSAFDKADRRIKGGVHAFIEDENGPIRRRITRSQDDVTGRMPTPHETRLLGRTGTGSGTRWI
jgi:hypothetical protein